MKLKFKTPTPVEAPKPKAKSEPIISEYKGKWVLVLEPESKFPFSFGLKKAQLIVEHLEAIKQFIVDAENHEKTP